MEYLEAKTFDELEVGRSAQLVRTLTRDQIELFAAVSGDLNPAHLDADYAQSSFFHHVVAHGMWSGALISAVLGTKLPGPGTIYLRQSLRFLHPVAIGDTVTVTVRVKELIAEKKRAIFDCAVVNDRGQSIVVGEAEVTVPSEPIRVAIPDLPKVLIAEQGPRLKELIEQAKGHPPIRTAVTHPVTATTLAGALEAARDGLIVPVLIGPRRKIEEAARELGETLSGIEIQDTPHSHAASAASVALAREGNVGAIMKGALHTDEIMCEVVSASGGLRMDRRVSHVFFLDVPAYSKPLLISDAAINIEPDLEAKRDIVQNAIDLARALGIETPKVALLSAVETVYPPIHSTIDAAALCKMAERGQIVGGILDGPLAFDNAISRAAAKEKGIVSPVAGDPDILIAPNLEAANMLAKQLDYLGGAVSAGIALGAKVPIILTSRAEGPLSRRASCALAQMFAVWKAVQ